MDMTKFAETSSNDLKAKDFIGKNLKVKIIDVAVTHYDATDSQPASDKARLSFEGKEKGLVLNTTNTQTLIAAYGKDSDSWVNHEIGLHVVDYTAKGFPHGWIVTPLDVAAPEFEDSIPF